MSSDTSHKSRIEDFTFDVVLSIALYTFCSSVMLVANKLAIHFVPMPAFVFCIQLAVSVVYVYAGGVLKYIEVDDWTWVKIKSFSPYTAAFVASVYANGRALQASNVETVIVFRACSPLFVSILDYFFLGRELPSGRSLFALLTVTAGAVGYMFNDSAFMLEGFHAYAWVSIYVVAIVVEMTYGKQLLKSIEFKTSVWGPVLYTNLTSLPFMAFLGVSAGELERLDDTRLGESNWGAFTLALSCIVGVGISWAGWNCRDKVSATTYTLIGVLCKVLSVMFNVLIWDKHASAGGIGCLMVCLVASSAYQQAPMRKTATSPNGANSTALDMMKTQNEEECELVGNPLDVAGNEEDAL
eukprot:gnl/MRDRNA2_/MRDRNA2_128987_c0_seq1.p1 gnl/MRDRNA2_/MRDRNA2_128987_c0~~gnl/MRDRNA2_/MRDRNA2_128987_c0_seq1.p1  ORF type:complete len:355 (-),score=38.55 gnl/MRDRNA2_/MRDRNA2_128987_c0_seq1:6-1070(-)